MNVRVSEKKLTLHLNLLRLTFSSAQATYLSPSAEEIKQSNDAGVLALNGEYSSRMKNITLPSSARDMSSRLNEFTGRKIELSELLERPFPSA